MTAFKITWIDRNREPQYPADPRYPNGIDLDMTRAASRRIARLRCPIRRGAADIKIADFVAPVPGSWRDFVTDKVRDALARAA